MVSTGVLGRAEEIGFFQRSISGACATCHRSRFGHEPTEGDHENCGVARGWSWRMSIPIKQIVNYSSENM